MLAAQPIAIPPVHGLGPVAQPPVATVCQVLANWCWAACTTMALRWYQNNAQMCDVAGRFLGKSCCCPPAVGCAACDLPVKTDDVVTIYSQWSMKANFVSAALQPDALKAELDQNRPVEIAVVPGACTASDSVIGHLAVIGGWTPTPQGDRFFLLDPFCSSDSSPVPYEYIQTGMFLGCWIYSWNYIQPNPVPKG
jgi:hypothetical protein